MKISILTSQNLSVLNQINSVSQCYRVPSVENYISKTTSYENVKMSLDDTLKRYLLLGKMFNKKKMY